MTFRHSIYILSLVTATITLVACSDNGYENELDNGKIPVSFNSITPNLTRATENSLSAYATDFRVYGVVKSGDKYDPVFNKYKVWYADNSAYTTNSNTSDWEYVSSDAALDQTIKYWDYSCEPYIFWAHANAAKADEGTYTIDTDGKVSKFVSGTLSQPTSTADLLYYTKPIVVKKNDYNKPVNLEFMCAYAKVRFAFYETVPGYAVKEMKFYAGSGTDGSDNCIVNGTFASGGNLTLTYDVDADNNYTNANVTSNFTKSGADATTLTLGTLNYTTSDGLDGDCYLATSSASPTYASPVNDLTTNYYSYMLPIGTGSQPLTVKVDFTLVSSDGKQTMPVTGATATIPKEYTQWNSNTAYTYILKIQSVNTSPITFDAYAVVDESTETTQTIEFSE